METQAGIIAPRAAYNQWAEQYDTNHNRTRDLEAVALRECLSSITLGHYLEMGCGTGKNTEWLATHAQSVTAVDLSEEMLAKAQEKIQAAHVRFHQADMLQPWNFATGPYDTVGFSLVLEHIAHLEPIFAKVVEVLRPGGYVYVGELHPFKQYAGTKARFETEQGTQVVECYNHHITDFISAAKQNGLQLAHLDEYFDADNREIPRILVLLFQK